MKFILKFWFRDMSKFSSYGVSQIVFLFAKKSSDFHKT